MSMLTLQVNKLRDKARLFEGYQNGEISRMMREAADTIESLRDRLQELQGVGGESRYSELFGTPERAAWTLAKACGECDEDMGAYADSLCDSIKERLDKLLHCLENDWHIRASWDGLRRFWCVELTDDGVRMRDEAATLGSGECEMIPSFIEPREMDDCQEFCCSKCGGCAEKQSWAYWNYCPNCGAKVVRRDG